MTISKDIRQTDQSDSFYS